MARITLDRIRHAYVPDPMEDDYALREVDYAFADGGAYALLGPSGCGKTTLLNIVSGLLTPSQGRILFDGRDVTGLAPERRNIAQVFQFPVVYDTMTVRENLAFPLRNRRVDEGTVRARVDEIIELIELGDIADRKARGLTADLKQKISLGRGLVRADVAAILFDEPLTVIDPHMKWQLRSQLKLLHQRFEHTMVYVTHDQTEALTFADRVVVMFEGRIVQIGTPQELWERPAHTFVGYFIGSPGMNVLPVRVDGATARLGDHAVALPHGIGEGGIEAGGELALGIRPENVRLHESAADGLPFRVEAVEDIGRQRIVRGTVEGEPLAVVLPEGEPLPAEPRATFEPAGINLYRDDWRVA